MSFSDIWQYSNQSIYQVPQYQPYQFGTTTNGTSGAGITVLPAPAVAKPKSDLAWLDESVESVCALAGLR